MHLDPHRLLVLHAVSDAGGVLAAARVLRLSPSGISQHLAAAEKETGLVLVDRSRRGARRSVTLTAAGRRLAEHGRRLADLLDEAGHDMAALDDRTRGRVRLAAFPTAIRHLVAPAVTSLAVEHPGVLVCVVELDDRPASAALHGGEVDVALVENETGTPSGLAGLTVEALVDDPFRVAVPPGWPLVEVVADLGRRRWIDGPPHSVTAERLRHLRAATGEPFPADHSCREFPAALDLVRAGVGAALVPTLAIDGDLDGVQLLDLAGLGGRTIALCRLARRPRSAVIDVLVHALRAAAGRRPGPVARSSGRTNGRG